MTLNSLGLDKSHEGKNLGTPDKGLIDIPTI